MCEYALWVMATEVFLLKFLAQTYLFFFSFFKQNQLLFSCKNSQNNNHLKHVLEPKLFWPLAEMCGLISVRPCPNPVYEAVNGYNVTDGNNYGRVANNGRCNNAYVSLCIVYLN